MIANDHASVKKASERRDFPFAAEAKSRARRLARRDLHRRNFQRRIYARGGAAL